MKAKLLRLCLFLLAFGSGYFVVQTLNKLIDNASAESIAANHVFPPKVDELSRLEILDDVNELSQSNSFEIKILETGEGFHGDEIDAKNGEKWVGLFMEKGTDYLREVQIAVKPGHDGYYDPDDKSIVTGKDVIVKGNNQPLFLIKNAKRLKNGDVETLYKGKTWSDVLSPEFDDSDRTPDDIMTKLKKGFVHVYNIGGSTFKLKVIEAQNLRNKKILALILESENRQQVLYTIELDSNPDLGTLYWAGDLDKDGKPDFYVDLFEHYNVTNKVLFLSSEAGEGELVRKSAQFWTTGC